MPQTRRKRGGFSLASLNPFASNASKNENKELQTQPTNFLGDPSTPVGGKRRSRRRKSRRSRIRKRR